MTLEDPASGARTTCQVVPPDYSENARRNGMRGRLRAALSILPDGTVSGVKVRQSTGHIELDDKGLIALMRASCTPFRNSAGQAIGGTGIALVTFALQRAASEPPQVLPPYEDAIARLIRSLDISDLIAIGVDQGLASMPPGITPELKARIRSCTNSRLTLARIEPVVRPVVIALLPSDNVARVVAMTDLLRSGLSVKARQAGAKGEPLTQAGISAEDVREFERIAAAPEARAVVEQRLIDRILAGLKPEMQQMVREASQACHRELEVDQPRIQLKRGREA
ncbi:hypothetical protein CS8_094060 [Cupriavidus sp. 8B]